LSLNIGFITTKKIILVFLFLNWLRRIKLDVLFNGEDIVIVFLLKKRTPHCHFKLPYTNGISYMQTGIFF